MRKLLWIVSVTAAAAFPATARADGIAFAGVKQGGNGIESTNARVHYVTLPGRKQTVVTKVGAEGRVLAFRPLAGAWGIPMVAFDESTGGLSADGRTLVLAQPPIGRMRKVSRFRVLETRALRPLAVVTLKGSFSFDALSPDASTLYLIEHVNRSDVAEYRVRAYDRTQKRLLPYVIRDHRSNQVEMYGYPMSRATSADGRWAYTLYQGGHHSFVHALDTVARTAVCVDLPMETPRAHVADAHLVVAPGGETVTVDSRTGGIIALIDTGDLSLRPVRADPPAAAPADESFRWLGLAGAFPFALALGLAVRRRGRAPTGSADAGHDHNDRRESRVTSDMSGSSLASGSGPSSPPANEARPAVAGTAPVRRDRARVTQRARLERRAARALRITRPR